ncbi:Diphosphomevalonate decarboxylase [Acipenser ruthenus]|uniref:Diphosphomevalonate decarboxylase n=1 Tax=Acipenser ruthenus TaxID=7906 RepID=A0A444U2W0_ACIRT|nr:Diphosphomevalonate decarboxylase [Acipenser ruthenus]
MLLLSVQVMCSGDATRVPLVSLRRECHHQVYTLARLCGVEGELSEVAHQGSGSACRSMYGGFVQWIMGDKPDGKDSIAERIQPDTHWPELRVLILVVSAEWKPVGSTAGMQTSVQTSPLLKVQGKYSFLYYQSCPVVRFLKGLAVSPVSVTEELKSAIGMESCPRGISYIINTKAGPGPRVAEDTSLHLLGSDGLPKHLKQSA